MAMYNSDDARWKAYQFSDPFAIGSFYSCSKITKTFCRPDCDASPKTNLKSEIKFVDSVEEAASFGFKPCKYCEPFSVSPINVSLLVDCVAHINKQIGFLSPLTDENEDVNNKKIKKNILESRKGVEKSAIQQNSRRLSAPVVNVDGSYPKDFDSSLSKNDFDHYKLVDLACRHLAYAAACNIMQPHMFPKAEEASGDSSKKKRRRGGVLGFKELATKSKLSAWHFHRVFKSVTGLTPKTYGDKCWEFIENCRNHEKYAIENSVIKDSHSPIAGSSSVYTPLSISRDSSLSAPTSPEDGPAQKKLRTNDFNNVMIGGDIKMEQDQTLTKDLDKFIKTPQFLDSVKNVELPLNKIQKSQVNKDVSPNSSEIFAPPDMSRFDLTLNHNNVESNNWTFFDDFSNQDTGFNMADSSHTRAFSEQDVTSLNNTGKVSLFSHMRRTQEPAEFTIAKPEAGIQDMSPIVHDISPNSDDILPFMLSATEGSAGDEMLPISFADEANSNLNISEYDTNISPNFEIDALPLSSGLPSELLASNLTTYSM